MTTIEDEIKAFGCGGTIHRYGGEYAEVLANVLKGNRTGEDGLFGFHINTQDNMDYPVKESKNRSFSLDTGKRDSTRYNVEVVYTESGCTVIFEPPIERDRIRDWLALSIGCEFVAVPGRRFAELQKIQRRY